MPPAAVIVGAIEDALGVPIDEAPLSPSRLFELVRAHGNGNRATPGGSSQW